MALTTPMKVILAVVIVALIGAGFYVVDWQKKWQEIEQLNADLAGRKDKLRKTEEEIKKLPDLTKQVEELEKELQSLVASKFTKEEPELFVANYIAEIERMVIGQQESTGDYDFSIVSITPGAQTNTQVQTGGGGEEGGAGAADAAAAEADAPEALQGFPTRVFQMQMTGRYATLVDFLYQLGALELDRLVTINKISLAPSSPGEGESPVLSVTIPITAYLRQGG